MTVLIVIEPTIPLRDWLRGQEVGEVSERVWAGGLPASPTLPAITITRIPGGGLDIPQEIAGFQFDVWADKASVAGSTFAALVSVLLGMPYRTALTDAGGQSLTCHGFDDATLTGFYAADPKDPVPHRYTIPAAQATFVTVPT